MSIYLDNAATTPLSNEVYAQMEPFIFNSFANPSSSHTAGKNARYAVELSRKIIAEELNADPENIFFTSGGTEADNMAILSAIATNNIQLVITSKLEHHAVLNTLSKAESDGKIKLVFLENDERGTVSLPQLDRLLQNSPQALVSLMHANNEIGNINPIADIADLTEHYGAIFHCDTVQSLGHYHYNSKLLCPDYIVGSAHKFHGPKGVGFLYAREPKSLKTLINGGSQERGKRAGTENVSGIVGMAAALQQSYDKLSEHENHIKLIKTKLINALSEIPGFFFNGQSGRVEESLSTVLSVSIPQRLGDLLGTLDQAEIYASGGSACSGNKPSHVISAIMPQLNQNTIRFSFSRYNTTFEIDEVINTIKHHFLINTSTLQYA